MSFFRRNRDDEEENDDEQESTSSGSSRPFSSSRVDDDRPARPTGRLGSSTSEGSPFQRSSTIFDRTSDSSDDEEEEDSQEGGRRFGSSPSSGSGFRRPGETSGGGGFGRPGSGSSSEGGGSGFSRPGGGTSSGGGSPFRRNTEEDRSSSEGERGSSSSGSPFRRSDSPSGSGGSGFSRPGSGSGSQGEQGSGFRRSDSPSGSGFGRPSGAGSSEGESGSPLRRSDSPSVSGFPRPGSSSPGSGSSGSGFRRSGEEPFGTGGARSTGSFSRTSPGGEGRRGEDKPTQEDKPSGGRFGGVFGRGGQQEKQEDDRGSSGSRRPATGSAKPEESSSGGRRFGLFGRGGQQEKQEDDKGSSGSRRPATGSAKPEESSSGGRRFGLFGRGGQEEKKEDDKGSSGSRRPVAGSAKPEESSSSGTRFGLLGGRSGQEEKKEDDRGGTAVRRSTTTTSSFSDSSSGGARPGLSRSPGESPGSSRPGTTPPASRSTSTIGGVGRPSTSPPATPSKPSSRSSSGKSTRGSSTPLPTTQRRVNVRNTGLSLDQKLDIIGIGLVALALLLGSGLLTSADSTSILEKVDHSLAQFFGIGRAVLPVFFLITGGWLLVARFGSAIDIEYLRIAGVVILFVALLISLQWYFLMFNDLPQPTALTDPLAESWVASKTGDFIEYTAYPSWEDLEIASQVKGEAGEGGGLLGHALYILLARQLGDAGVIVFLGITWLIALYFTAQTSTNDIAERIRNYRHARQMRREARLAKREMKAAEKAAVTAGAAVAVGASVSPAPVSIPSTTKPAEPTQPVQRPLPTPSSTSTTTTETAPVDPAKDAQTSQRAPRFGGVFGRRTASPETDQTQTSTSTTEEQPTRAPAAEKQPEDKKEGRKGIFGRRLVGGRVEADKEGEDAKGRRQVEETALAEGQGGGRRFGIFGRRGAAPSTTPSSAEPKAEGEQVKTPAASETTEGKEAQTPQQTSRFSFPGRRKPADAATEAQEGTTPSDTSDTPQRRGLLGMRRPAGEAKTSSPETPGESSGGRRFGVFGRKPAETPETSTTPTPETGSDDKAPAGGRRFGMFGRKPAETPETSTTPTPETGSDDKAPAGGRRFGLFGRKPAEETPSQPDTQLTPSEPTEKPSETVGVAEVATVAAPETETSEIAPPRRPMFGRQQPSPSEDKPSETDSAQPVRRSFGEFRRSTTTDDTQPAERTSPFGRRPSEPEAEQTAPTAGRQFEGRPSFGRRLPSEDSQSTTSDTSLEAEKPITLDDVGSDTALGKKPEILADQPAQPTAGFATFQARPAFGRQPVADQTEQADDDPLARLRAASPATEETPETVQPVAVVTLEDEPSEDQAEVILDKPAQPSGRFSSRQQRPTFGRKPEAEPSDDITPERFRSARQTPAETPAEDETKPEEVSDKPARPAGRFGSLQQRSILGHKPEDDSPFARQRTTSPAESKPAETDQLPAAVTLDDEPDDEKPEVISDKPAQPTGRFGSPQQRSTFGRKPETEHDQSVTESPFARTQTPLAIEDKSTEVVQDSPATIEDKPDQPTGRVEMFRSTPTPPPEEKPATPPLAVSPPSAEVTLGDEEDEEETFEDVFADSSDEPETPKPSDDRLREVIRNRGRLEETPEPLKPVIPTPSAGDAVTAAAGATVIGAAGMGVSGGQASPRPAVKPPVAETPTPPAPKPSKIDWKLPNFMDLLEPGSEQDIDQYFLLEQARVIEDTLSSFGAPGKVVEVNSGPVITQFGVEPDYIERRGGRNRVKVSAIAALDKDIALALAAKSIRIEAPVPGKGFVGIEVPNAQAALVSLRDVMSSEEHQRMAKKTSLAIGLGQSVDGSPISADLTNMPHLLIAGTTGSGKSVCVNAIISCLLLQNTPDDLQMIMVDPKRVELTGYNGIPHLISNVVVDLERIIGVLKWVQREMDERYRKLNERVCRNIQEYNRKAERDGFQKLAYLVVIIDELADLMMLAPDETEKLIARLAQMARATGIHLIISTQRPSVDVVTGLIKANFPARIAFAVASGVDSRVILDQPGADRLLGRGDMLFQAPDASAPVRMQGVYVSDPELDRITRYWKEQAIAAKRGGTFSPFPKPHDSSEPLLEMPTARSERYGYEQRPTAPATPQPPQPPPSPTNQRSFWAEVDEIVAESKSENLVDGDEEDDLYSEAVEVVRSLNKASVSLLQRRLRIGYTRAARLIDLMEQRGIIGAAESGSKPRPVFSEGDEEA